MPFFFKRAFKINLFGAVLCLTRCVWASLVAASRGYSLAVVHGFLVAVSSLVAELRLYGASATAVHRFSCPGACGIFPVRGLNPCSLPWQAASKPLDRHGSPLCYSLMSSQKGCTFLKAGLIPCLCIPIA